MLEQSLIIALCVMAFWMFMWEGNILHFVRHFGDWHLPVWVQKPLYDCPMCMTPYYGSIVYTIMFHHSWYDWAFTILIAMGINTVLVKLMPDP